MEINSFDIKELENLSPEVQKLALQMLSEYSETGVSQTYNDILYEDYNEIPVDIDTFITDPYYLGKAWMDSAGNCKMYPFWRKVLRQIFPDPFTTAVNNVIESGARGLGKSEIGVTIGLYLMHRILCMKNPNDYFGLKPTEKIAFAFMNITKTLAEAIGISKFQETVQMSPWFLEHGNLSTRGRTLWSPPDTIHIIVGSQSSHVIGQPIYFAMFDEISFIRNQDIEKQKAIATDMMDTAIGGMKTRFIHKGKNPTVLVLASSKRSDKSFLEEHMKKKLAEDHEGTFIVDEPVWNVKPPETYCGKKFLVGVGNRFLTSEILPEGADKKEYIDKGYNVIEVPVEFYVDFSDNIDRALCDYAGISSSELTKYISSSRWEAVKDINYKNPFIKDVISVGNAPDDIAEYYDFIDMSRFNVDDMEHPLYVHLDMSKSGDKTGIAGVWIMGKQPDKDGNPGEMYYKLAFSVSIEAPKGYQISMEKNRHFIYWLKENNFVLRGVSTDTFQNVAIEQDLIAKGYPYSIISVDRVDSASKTCKPYAYFKNTIYERRVSIYDCELLTLEALQLERNGNTGKVDHPDGQSKDQCDAFCAAMWNASQHADEFAFEYGEDIDSTVNANNAEAVTYEQSKKQIEVDMEEILKDIYDPLKSERQKNDFTDFGFGSAQALQNDVYMVSNGIII